MKTNRSFKLLAFILSVIITLEVFPFAVLADGGNAGAAAYEAGEQTPEAADAEVFYDAVGELEELRTETGKYLRMEDGSFTAVTYPFAVHFEENGRFVEYDNALSLKEENGGTYYVPKKNGGACGFASESGSGVLYYLGKNGAKISVSAVSLGGCAVRSVSAEPIGKRENKKETLCA